MRAVPIEQRVALASRLATKGGNVNGTWRGPFRSAKAFQALAETSCYARRHYHSISRTSHVLANHHSALLRKLPYGEGKEHRIIVSAAGKPGERLHIAAAVHLQLIAVAWHHAAR